MTTWLRRLRQRLADADIGNDFLDSCCHRIGGQLRAGPATEHNSESPRTDPER